MNTDLISAPLKRNLKPGSKYNKLFPKVSCQTTNLGNGSNDTIEGVDFMAQWVEKYSWQVKKLVDVLKREGALRSNTLFNLAQDIYKFEYNHLQYTADAALQQLRSPACAWKQRKQGLDCKSYTIFAMAMLQQLGISAAIRQVKQPGANSDLWTHVYVVVPKNQDKPTLKDLENENDYLVIDATRHSNIEVGFIDKKDKMIQKHQYVGLNAPSSGTLTESEYNSMIEFQKVLEYKGFSKTTIQMMFEYLESLFKQGYSRKQVLIYPTLKGINIQPSKNESGKSFTYSANGLLGEETQEGVFKDLFSEDWFDSNFGSLLDTIGNFLKTGMICDGWFRPGSIERESKLDFPFILDYSGLNNAINDANYQKFQKAYMLLFYRVDEQSKEDYIKCTTQSLAEYKKVIQAFRKSVDDKLKSSGFDLTPKTVFLGGKNVSYPQRFSLSLDFPGYGKVSKTNIIYFPTILSGTGDQNINFDDVIPSSNNNNSNNSNNNNNSSNNGSGSNNGNSFSTPDSFTKSTKSTSTNLSTASLGVAAGALILLWPTLKKQLAKNKKSTPKTK